MDRVIRVNKSTCADTRTCDFTKVSQEQLEQQSRQHISDVEKGLDFFVDKLRHAATNHDYTKLTEIARFHDDFKTGFLQTDWWDMHQDVERHHFNEELYIQDDVNLIDILEMITDGVMAGLARSGKYRQEDIPEWLLKKAFDNTIQLLLQNVSVTELNQ